MKPRGRKANEDQEEKFATWKSFAFILKKVHTLLMGKTTLHKTSFMSLWGALSSFMSHRGPITLRPDLYKIGPRFGQTQGSNLMFEWLHKTFYWIKMISSKGLFSYNFVI